MKKNDILKLSQLLSLKQQAASLKYRKRLAEQQRLHDEAARLMRDSLNPALHERREPAAGDLIVANRFRKSLRKKSEQLTAAAHSLDDMVDALRANTREALTREAALERLLTDLKKKIRADANNRDEDLREQNTLIKR